MVLWTSSSSASTTHNPFLPSANPSSSSFETHSSAYYQYQEFSHTPSIIPSITVVVFIFKVRMMVSFYSLFSAEVLPTSA
jgi:hypothetical protein